MPTVKINLHAHERKSSWDSSTPTKLMTSAYNTLGYSGVGFVGHEEIPDVDSEQLIIFNGVEKEISSNPEIHVVEFEEIGFSFLAHPQRTGLDKEQIEDLVTDLGVDGVEKFSDGLVQYEGDIDTIELSNDDAHNIMQIGTSFMEVEVNEINRGQIVQAIKRGDIRLNNNRRRVIGQAIKSINAAAGKVLRDRG